MGVSREDFLCIPRDAYSYEELPVRNTVIAAGFREAARRQPHQKPSYLPKTWKAGREEEAVVEPQQAPQEAPRPVGNEIIHQENTTAADDLDVPTFLRRAAQKA